MSGIPKYRAKARAFARLPDEREHPLVVAAVVEADEEDALVVPKAQVAVHVRDLLGSRAHQERDEPRTLGGLGGDEPFQQALEVREESGLTLLDADERRIAVRGHVRDSAPTRVRDLALHVIRDRKSTRLNSSHVRISYA